MSGVAGVERVWAVGRTALLGFVVNRVNVNFSPRRLGNLYIVSCSKKNTLFRKLDLLPYCGDRVCTGPVIESSAYCRTHLYVPYHLVTCGPQQVQLPSDVFLFEYGGCIRTRDKLRRNRLQFRHELGQAVSGT